MKVRLVIAAFFLIIKGYSQETFLHLKSGQKYNLIIEGNMIPGVVNNSDIQKLSQPFLAMAAFYSALGGSGCNGVKCDLTTALGLGNQGSEKHKALIRNYFPNDTVASVALEQDCFQNSDGASFFSGYSYLRMSNMGDTVKVEYSLTTYVRGETGVTKGPDYYVFQNGHFKKIKRNIWSYLEEKPVNQKVKKAPSFTLDSLKVYKSHYELQLAFGESVVKDYFEFDGESHPISILFPDNPDKKVTFHWLNEDYSGFNGVQIEVDYSIQQPLLSSNWKLKNGITIGTPLEKIVALNGKPITFYGFEWDYGGLITGYNGGKLSNKTMSLQLNMAKINSALMGDKKLSSDLPSVKSAKCFITSITLK